MKKTEMATFVSENKKRVSKQLQEMITYTMKMYKDDAKSVTAQDFRSLVKDIQNELAIATPVATAASKKSETADEKPAKKAKKSAKKEETVEEEKPKKKSGAKKAKKFAKGVESQNTKGEAFDLAEVFHDEIETPLGLITKDDSIKTIKDVAKLLEEGEKEVLCAVYWTERHLSQFDYSNVEGIEAPKSFENDLDLVSIIFVAPDNSYILGVSSYTFVPYVFSAKSMKQKNGIRYTNGAEFNVYTVDADEEAE